MLQQKVCTNFNNKKYYMLEIMNTVYNNKLMCCPGKLTEPAKTCTKSFLCCLKFMSGLP